ncbi:glucose transporter GlcU [Bacillaceae bacterium Marseille-Q3522]|nr:glucose transporter GlcU [Bacillaceae bacterium Marseille-Q3522]
MSGLLIGLIPALGWGFQSIVMQKIGGKYTNKQMGMVFGTIILALVITIFKRPEEWTAGLIWGSLLSGVFWSFGQILQIKSFDLLGVTRAMPISTGTQLIGTVLVGILYFKEWDFQWQVIIGIIALLLIILGVTLTTFKEGKTTEGSNIKLGVIFLLFSSLGFVGYCVFPRIFSLSGWDVVLPQAIAMFISTIVICLTQPDHKIWDKKSFQNIGTGVCFAIANLTILFSNEMNGVAIGFTLSQMNVVVATLGGLFILHEHKTKKELKYVLGGLLLVVAGGILIGITKS